MPRSRALVLLALLIGAMPSQVNAQRMESRSEHYTVFYQAGFEQDVEFTRRWLDATERLMKAKYQVAPDRYFMSIYLLPAPSGDITVDQSGQNQCCATAGGVRTGAIRLLTRSAEVWKGSSLISTSPAPPMVFMAFLAAEFGEDVHARILRSAASTFEAAMAAETRPYSNTELYDRFRKWLETVRQ